MESTKTHLEELQEHLKAQDEIIEDFMSTDSEIKAAQNRKAAIQAEINEVKATQARGELFSDGADQQKQVSDEQGQTYTEESQHFEPDITSENGTGEVEPKGTTKKSSRKRGEKTTGESPTTTLEKPESSISGYSQSGSGENTTLVVGQHSPELGYAMQPGFERLLKANTSPTVTRDVIANIYETHRENVFKVLAPLTKIEEANRKFHRLIENLTEWSIQKLKNPKPAVVATEPVAVAPKLVEKEDTDTAMLEWLVKQGVKPEHTRPLFKRALAAAGDKPTPEAVRQQCHIIINYYKEMMAQFAIGEGDTRTEKLIDKYLSIKDTRDRYKAQYESMVADLDKTLAEFDEFIMPGLMLETKTKLETTGSTKQFIDYMTGRIQLKNYKSAVSVKDRAVLDDFFWDLSIEERESFGVKTVLTYDVRELLELRKKYPPLLPEEAFQTSEPLTKAYIQRAK